MVVPWLRNGGRDIASTFLRETGERFRLVGWVCFAVLVPTGSFNLWMRGVTWSSFLDPRWRASSFGTTVLLKLGLFACILVISLFHDFIVGPRATDALRRDPSAESTQRLRRRAALLGRMNAALALVVVAVAVTLVRGLPW